MTYTETVIPGVWIIEPKVLKDARGYFMEAFKQAEFEEHIGKIHVKNKVYHILYYEIYIKQYHARKHRSVLIHILRVHDKAA